MPLALDTKRHDVTKLYDEHNVNVDQQGALLLGARDYLRQSYSNDISNESDKTKIISNSPE